MPSVKTGKVVHDETCGAAEGSRQSAARAAGASAATVAAADVAFYRSWLASARANGTDQGAAIHALWTLGVRDPG